MDDKPVGILFVHGIGVQRRGDTLITSGEAVAAWWQRWLSNRGRAQLRMTDAATETSVSGAPAHGYLHLTVEAEGQLPQTAKWLLAESHWADSFRPPSFKEVLIWSLLIGPYVVLSLFGSQWSRMIARLEDNYLWALVFIPYLLAQMAVFLLAGILVEAVALSLLVLAAIPIPPLPAIAAVGQRLLTSFVGDSYILSSSPVRFAAMASQIERDLAWLSERARAVAIVAHSQGAAVAYETLRLNSGCRPQLFITYGQGITKLDSIREFRGLATMLTGYMIAGVILVALFGRDIIYNLGEWEGHPVNTNRSGFGFGGLLMILFTFLFGLVIAKLAKLRPKQLEGIMWRDFYATADPVSDGPLPGAGNPGTPKSEAVVNQGFFLSDHTNYWHNYDDFIARVVLAVDEMAESGLLDREALEEAHRAALPRRARRTRYLGARRWLVLLGFFATLWRFWPDLPALGTSVLNLLDRTLLNLSRLNGVSDTALNTTGTAIAPWLVGLGALALPFALWYLLSFWVWKLWQIEEVGAFFGADGRFMALWFYLYSYLNVLFSSVCLATIVLGDKYAVSSIFRLDSQIGVTTFLTGALILAVTTFLRTRVLAQKELEEYGLLLNFGRVVVACVLALLLVAPWLGARQAGNLLWLPLSFLYVVAYWSISLAERRALAWADAPPLGARVHLAAREVEDPFKVPPVGYASIAFYAGMFVLFVMLTLDRNHFAAIGYFGWFVTVPLAIFAYSRSRNLSRACRILSYALSISGGLMSLAGFRLMFS